jgi:pimeloyl-ACP methyl ester carboxylesterase
MLDTARERWPGRVVAPDLPGHGDSSPLERYSFDSLGEAVARVIDDDTGLVVLGHSLGGVIALALASGSFGVQPRAVVGLGIKVAWSDDDLGRAAALAAREPQWFETHGEALFRHLRVSGLAGLVADDDPAAGRGVREEGGRFRLALDNAAFGVGAPDMTGLLAAARCPVTLARGEHDALNTDGQLRELVADPVSLPGLGHNAHVEDSSAIWTLVAPSS